VTAVPSANLALAAGASAEVDARCPSGQSAISGGFSFPETGNGVGDLTTYYSSRDADGGGWSMGFVNHDGTANTVFVIAYCAAAPAIGTVSR
jgi:hypothetical protein